MEILERYVVSRIDKLETQVEKLEKENLALKQEITEKEAKTNALLSRFKVCEKEGKPIIRFRYGEKEWSLSTITYNEEENKALLMSLVDLFPNYEFEYVEEN